MPYTDQQRRMKKWFERTFIGRSASQDYRQIQRREVRRLLRDLVQHPEGFASHVKR